MSQSDYAIHYEPISPTTGGPANRIRAASGP